MEKFSHIEHNHRAREKARPKQGGKHSQSHSHKSATDDEQRAFKLIIKHQSGCKITEADG